jgi:hypothetical protein
MAADAVIGEPAAGEGRREALVVQGSLRVQPVQRLGDRRLGMAGALQAAAQLEGRVVAARESLERRLVRGAGEVGGRLA